MRIRSIRPEFWTSAAISSLSIEDRLLFIGLWSYVDDNGVGLDRLSLITTDLFPDDVERNPRETFARVSRGLATLSTAGRITRYEVDGKDYLSITNWAEHQKIDRPGKARYPLPTTGDAQIRDTLATPSRDTRDTPSTGEGEKGRRGEGEKDSCSPDADAPSERVSIDDEFADWYANYPRKVGRGQALKAYRAARKKVDHQTLVDRLVQQIPVITAKGAEFTPHPATWLNGERWDDDHEVTTPEAATGGWQAEEPLKPRHLFATDDEYRAYLERRSA